MDVALSVAIQRMVRSDVCASGVAFSLDTETRFRDVVLITGTWGLGELLVQGQVIPDEFLVAKKMLGKAPMPIIGKRRGKKDIKMIYAKRGHAGPLRLERQTNHRARESGRTHRRTLHQNPRYSFAHGRGVGARRSHQRAFHTAGAPRDGAGESRH